MKKILAILILSVMCIHLAGFYAYFVVRQNQIRQEMREAIGTLPTQDFQRFVFKKEEYQKVRVNDHEVRINDKMYDHGAPTFEGEMIVLLALHDEAEDSLISLFKELIESSSQDKKPVPSQLFSFLNLIFITESSLFLPTVDLAAQKICFDSTAPLDVVLPIPSPPPRI